MAAIKNPALISKHGIITNTAVDDCHKLALLAREEDRREVEDLSGETLIDNLLYGQKNGHPCLTIHTHSKLLLGIFGVIPIWAGMSAVAFIGTREVENNKVAFMRGARDVLAFVETLPDCDGLTNIVDCRNTLHIKFLLKLGFHIHERIENFNGSGFPALKFWNFPKIITDKGG